MPRSNKNLGPLNEAERAAMRSATHEAALVLVDDLRHIKDVVTNQYPKIGDVRRLCGVLRRILIYDDLRKIAASRIGKVQFLAPDNRPFIRANGEFPFVLIFADNVSTFGISLSTFSVDSDLAPHRKIKSNPDDYKSLSFDAFCNQKVICLNGEWVTRAQIIKYIANVASGVHTTNEKEREHFLIRKLRGQFSIESVNDTINIVLDSNLMIESDIPISVSSKKIDPIILSLMATGQHLCSSPDVERLILNIEDYG